MNQYEKFLEVTSLPEADSVHKFQDKDAATNYMGQACRFGDLIYDALTAIAGSDNRYYRLLIV
jgi:hypothetical protein